MTLLWYFAIVGSHTFLLAIGYVFGKPYLDKRFNKPQPTQPTNKTGVL